MSTVKYSPCDAIPDVGQRPKDDCEISSIVGREERRNVFEDDNLGATRRNELSKVVEESRLLSSETTSGSHASEADVLAREASRPDLGVRDVIWFHSLDVCDAWNVRPVLCENIEAEVLLFALPDRFDVRAIEAEVKAPNTCKKTGHSDLARRSACGR